MPENFRSNRKVQPFYAAPMKFSGFTLNWSPGEGQPILSQADKPIRRVLLPMMPNLAGKHIHIGIFGSSTFVGFQPIRVRNYIVVSEDDQILVCRGNFFNSPFDGRDFSGPRFSYH